MDEVLGEVPGYLVETPIGNDSSGRVWRGRRSGSTDQVALLRVELHDVAEFVSARSAATLLVELEHPNLVRVHELVPSGTAVVLVMDLAAGGSFAEVLDARGALSPSEMIATLAPIADALDYLHNSGVVHGDICPANVVFTEAGMPMLANLGAARLRGDTEPVHSTPDYIDPGVAAGFLPGPQSDVFMLAGVAVHALTGAALWPGEGVEHVLLNALIADVDNLDGRLDAAAVPASLQKVLRRALSVEPGGRGTAAELALDLRACAPGAVGPLASRLRIAAASSSPVVAAALASEPAALASEPTAVTSEPAVPVPVPVPAPAPAPAPAVPATSRARGGHRYQHQKRGRPSTRVIVGGVLVGGLLVGGGLAWAFSNAGANHPAAASVTSSPAELAPAPAVGGAPDSLSVDPASPSGRGSLSTAAAIGPAAAAADASNALVELDALREQAFARRAPLLLTGVYEPGVLLDEDTASLERIVPAGCGLEGVHTAYSDVQITGRSDSEIDLTAEATLSPSVLFCNGVAKARAPGSGPSALHMVLIRSGAHFLIHSVSS